MSIKSILTSLLAWYFRSVPLPASFNFKPDGKVIVAGLSDSIVTQALLESFISRAKSFEQVNYGIPEAYDSKQLNWFYLHDRDSLNKIVADISKYSITCLSIFESNGPIHNNPSYRLNWFRLLGIIIFARSLHISFSQPRKFSGELTQERLKRFLKLEFYRDLKLFRGTPFQSIKTQAELTLSGAEFERELGLIATKMRISRERAFVLARKEFYTIAANPIRPFYSIAAKICDLITSRLFSEVICTGLDEFSAAARSHTVVLVPMHRSHLDYILVGQKLFESHVNPPLVAAGLNLSFWPIGFFIRSLGAYFVRRNARHDRIHALVLKRYVNYLVKRGHSQEFFIEGGRSRSGRMRSPKVGLLNIMIEACLKGQRRELVFIPVSITYENVIEAKTFGDENSGHKKQKESLISLIKVRSIFKKSYGEVLMSFGSPISLSSVSARLPKESEPKSIVKEVAATLIKEIQGRTAVSLTGLIYTALMCAPRYGLTRDELSHAVRELADAVVIAQEINPTYGSITPSLERFLSGHDGALSDIVRGGIVERGQIFDREAYFIPGRRRYTADFYKNSLLHVFLPIGVLSLLDLVGSPFKANLAEPLYQILKQELFLPSQERFISDLNIWIQALVKRKYLRKSGASFAFNSHKLGIFIPALLASTVESVLWAFSNIKALSQPETPLAFKTLLSQLQGDFKTAMYLNLMTRTESSSQSSLQSALEILSATGVISLQERNGAIHEVTLQKSSSSELDFVELATHRIKEWQCGAKRF